MKDNLLFIDTETTGVEENDRIVQLAFKIGGEETWCESLFKPPVPISIEAMSITHITNEHVANKSAFKGSSIHYELCELVVRDDVVLVAHNAAFDLRMLVKDEVPVPKRYICTMKIAHHHDKSAELTKHNLQYLRYYYGLKFDDVINPHDALSDILVLEKLLEFYQKFYTIEEMVAISARPILLKKMPFGKHKGEFFKDIVFSDRSYMEWMFNSMEMDENMRHTVVHYLKGHHLTGNF